MGGALAACVHCVGTAPHAAFCLQGKTLLALQGKTTTALHVVVKITISTSQALDIGRRCRGIVGEHRWMLQFCMLLRPSHRAGFTVA